MSKKSKTDPATSTADLVWDKLKAAEKRIVSAQNALSAFAAENTELVSQFLKLTREEEEAIETAKSIYAENIALAGSRWGGFAAHEHRDIDAYVLYDNLDDKIISQVLETKLTVNRAAYDAALADGSIDPTLNKIATKVSVRIISPKRVLGKK